MKITEHTLINFLNKTHIPSRITLSKIQNYIQQIQTKIQKEQKKQLAKSTAPIVEEDVRDELMDVMYRFNRSAPEWANDMGLETSQLLQMMMGGVELSPEIKVKVKDYLKAIRLVIKLMDKVKNSKKDKDE